MVVSYDLCQTPESERRLADWEVLSAKLGIHAVIRSVLKMDMLMFAKPQIARFIAKNRLGGFQNS